MKVLVTGGAGFIGSHLADELCRLGHDVSVVDNLYFGERDNVPQGARFYDMSIADRRLPALLRRERPEVVFHLAAQTSVTHSVRHPAFDARVNVTGSANLIKGCIECGVRKVVYAASGGTVYGEPLYLPVDEGHPVSPLSPYGISKHTVERYLELYSTLTGLSFTVLRYPNVYGPRQKPTGEAGVVAIFAYQMLRGEQPTIFGDGKKTRDYVYVSDVVRANLAAITRGDGAVYNLGTGQEITDQEVFDTVAKATGYKGSATYTEIRPGELYRIALDASKAKRELDWEATVPFEEGVALAVNYITGQL